MITKSLIPLSLLVITGFVLAPITSVANTQTIPASGIAKPADTTDSSQPAVPNSNSNNATSNSNDNTTTNDQDEDLVPDGDLGPVSGGNEDPDNSSE